MRTDTKLTALCQYLGERIDSIKSNNDFSRGLYLGLSIGRIQIQNILFELLDKALTNSLEDDGECV